MKQKAGKSAMGAFKAQMVKKAKRALAHEAGLMTKMVKGERWAMSFKDYQIDGWDIGKAFPEVIAQELK